MLPDAVNNYGFEKNMVRGHVVDNPLRALGGAARWGADYLGGRTGRGDSFLKGSAMRCTLRL